MEGFKGKEKLNRKKNKSNKFAASISLNGINEKDSISTNFESNKSKEQIINQAINYHQKGNIKEAKKYYQLCLDQGYQDERVFTNYGVIKQQEGDFDKAIDLYQKSIYLSPDNANTYLNLSNLWKTIGKLEKAEESMRKVIDIMPNYAEANLSLGNILKSLGKLEEAEILMRKAIDIKPNFAEAYFNLGNILKDIDKLDQAEMVMRQAIEIKPNFVEAYLNLGNILQARDQFENALIATKRAIEINPNYAEALSNLGTIYLVLEKYKQAEESTRKAIEIKPDLIQSHSTLGTLLRYLGKTDEAEASLREALRLNPDQPEALNSLSFTLIDRGEYDLAIKYFNQCSDFLRGVNNKEPSHLRFRRISKAKIDHDIEQFQYLVSQGIQAKMFNDLIKLYVDFASKVNWTNDTKLIILNDKYHNLIKKSYNHIIYKVDSPRLKSSAVSHSLNVKEITQKYFEHDFGLTYIDNFLSPLALEGIRKFLLGSTIWFDIKEGGYIGAYLMEGLASPLIIQIAEELRTKFPKIFKEHRLEQAWAYKYDSRAKNAHSKQHGINVHADFAAVNVNFWITNREANLNSSSGGLIVYDVEAPKEWDFKTYNNDEMRIKEELKKSKGNTKVIPYKENRAVLFNSNLFHETDNYEFKEGYENRRINVTMLFGRRNS
ncbi:tetratricopeptide repeat protein [Prochlorococcus marinus]|uniref:tetratricopeptide repeat protein n=1 Tax=Prochlorococcus marinus TaxID=1219 RepID=UPI0022B563C7|nr:tetratricopeptide repeat protein [Prochlorococcus marinus]